MPASTRPNPYISVSTIVTADDVTVRTQRVDRGALACADIGELSIMLRGRTLARAAENLARMGERMARDARRCAHAHRRLLRTEQLAQAVATANERAAIATLGRAA